MAQNEGTAPLEPWSNENSAIGEQSRQMIDASPGAPLRSLSMVSKNNNKRWKRNRRRKKKTQKIQEETPRSSSIPAPSLPEGSGKTPTRETVDINSVSSARHPVSNEPHPDSAGLGHSDHPPYLTPVATQESFQSPSVPPSPDVLRNIGCRDERHSGSPSQRDTGVPSGTIAPSTDPNVDHSSEEPCGGLGRGIWEETDKRSDEKLERKILGGLR
jgi:hypothetical protein